MSKSEPCCQYPWSSRRSRMEPSSSARTLRTPSTSSSQRLASSFSTESNRALARARRTVRRRSGSFVSVHSSVSRPVTSPAGSSSEAADSQASSSSWRAALSSLPPTSTPPAVMISSCSLAPPRPEITTRPWATTAGARSRSPGTTRAVTRDSLASRPPDHSSARSSRRHIWTRRWPRCSRTTSVRRLASSSSKTTGRSRPVRGWRKPSLRACAQAPGSSGRRKQRAAPSGEGSGTSVRSLRWASWRPVRTTRSTVSGVR
ncbi:hypothetical protein SALBM135S_01169 [Streptomyces alboniger]